MSDRLNVAVIRFKGELDVGRKQELREQLVLPPDARGVLLDLSDVTYADSTALTQLLNFGALAAADRVPVAVLAVAPQFVRLVQYAGLTEAFAVFADRASALTFLESPA